MNKQIYVINYLATSLPRMTKNTSWKDKITNIQSIWNSKDQLGN